MRIGRRHRDRRKRERRPQTRRQGWNLRTPAAGRLAADMARQEPGCGEQQGDPPLIVANSSPVLWRRAHSEDHAADNRTFACRWLGSGSRCRLRSWRKPSRCRSATCAPGTCASGSDSPGRETHAPLELFGEGGARLTILAQIGSQKLGMW
jgi:hypothetical protein